MARASEKVAISVDAELLAKAEQLRSSTGESRSALVSRALRLLLRAEERARKVAQYVDAYQRLPESEDEVRQARALARRSLERLPWEPR